MVTETAMQLLISGAEDARIVLHDVRHASAGERGAGAVAALAGHSSWVLCADVSPDGRMVLSGCVPPLVPTPCRRVRYSCKHRSIAYQPHAMVRSVDKSIKTWDLAARAAVSTLHEASEIWAVAWRPNVGADSGAFSSAGKDGVVRWWRAAGTGTG
jgi:WD repeat-containing protein 61